jgi:hypothetical protein
MSAAVDASRYEVPAGFKQKASDLRRVRYARTYRLRPARGNRELSRGKSAVTLLAMGTVAAT